ncbi:MAG: SRPBCC domain-containing protein [Tepidisphaeraceae bacterium]
MKQIDTEISIDAPANRIWTILTDFAHFQDWNPFITHIEGQPQRGARLTVTIQPPDSKAMRFRPVVLKAEPGQELRWLGHLLLPGLFDGEHVFSIEPTGEKKVLFRQSEQFGGLLVPLLWGKMGDKTRRGFEAMNEAIKQIAESK